MLGKESLGSSTCARSALAQLPARAVGGGRRSCSSPYKDRRRAADLRPYEKSVEELWQANVAVLPFADKEHILSFVATA